MEDFWKRVTTDKEHIRFLQASSYSPYCEFSKNGLKEEKGLTYLTVNAFYRYDRIMESMFAKKHIKKELRDWLFDIYMHYLTELEYRTGVTRQEIAVKEIKRELECGIYGRKIKDTYLILDEKDKYYIAHMLHLQEKTRESVDKFSDVLVTVLKDGIVYKYKDNEKQLLFYINSKENEKENAIIQMICELFMPLGYELIIFRENHFAVIGETKTLIIDEIQLL